MNIFRLSVSIFFLTIFCFQMTGVIVPDALHAASTGTLESLVLSESDLPDGGHFSDSDYTRSIQAKLLYDSPDMYTALIGNVREKRSQFIQGLDNDNGTILYLVFDKPVQATFLKALIWGGDGPTKDHPEELLVRGNTLVIISFAHGSATGGHIGKLLSKRLEL